MTIFLFQHPSLKPGHYITLYESEYFESIYFLVEFDEGKQRYYIIGRFSGSLRLEREIPENYLEHIIKLGWEDKGVEDLLENGYNVIAVNMFAREACETADFRGDDEPEIPIKVIPVKEGVDKIHRMTTGSIGELPSCYSIVGGRLINWVLRDSKEVAGKLPIDCFEGRNRDYRVLPLTPEEIETVTAYGFDYNPADPNVDIDDRPLLPLYDPLAPIPVSNCQLPPLPASIYQTPSSQAEIKNFNVKRVDWLPENYYLGTMGSPEWIVHCEETTVSVIGKINNDSSLSIDSIVPLTPEDIEHVKEYVGILFKPEKLNELQVTQRS